MKVQTYNGRHYVISNNRIIGDFTNLADAEGIVATNNRENPPQKDLISSLEKWAAEFQKAGHPVTLTLHRGAAIIRDLTA